MKKKYTFPSYSLLLCFLCALFLLPACQSARLSTADANKPENLLTEAQILASGHDNMPQEPAFVQASAETYPSDDMPAAASTQADLSAVEVTSLAHPATLVRAPVAKTTMPVAEEKTTSAKQIQKKLSLPARMMVKSIVKKAEKLQKKDITSTSEQQEINNNRYLVAGIILLLAGLILVLVGNTTLLYVLGSVASLAGLIFLLLAIL
jgi:Ca2+/Na+ antiporter